MQTRRFLAAVVALAALSGPAWAQQKVEARHPAAPDGRVEIENMAGSIHVLAWDKEEVFVTGTLGHGGEGLNVTGTPTRTRVEVETRGNPHAVHSDIEVHVPRASRVGIESFSAAITVADVAGEVRAESVNGSIAISGPAKEVDAQTVSGTVEVLCPSARVKAESVNGSVTVRGAAGEVDANTVNGSLEVLGGGAIERGHLETVSGSVRFDGEITGKGTLDLESVSGDVEIVLPAKTSADFEFSSFSGDILNEFGQGPAARRTSKWTNEKELEFTTGTGGARISAKTLSGDIRLRATETAARKK